MEHSSVSAKSRQNECLLKVYARASSALNAVLSSDKDAVAYRCGWCDLYHVAKGHKAQALNVPLMMAEGRFIAG